MVVGIAIAAGFGLVGGLTAGSYIFPAGTNPKSYKFLHEAADHDDSVLMPKIEATIPSSMRELLHFAPTWTTWPDYDKVTMVNRIIKNMWPYLDKAVMSTVIYNVAPILEQVKQQVPGGILEDLSFDEDNFTLGTIPLRVGGIKVYKTQEDEAILESTALWGGNCKMKVNVKLRVGPAAIEIPVVITNVQMKGQARVTFKPLVETIPCLGGMSLSLLEMPEFDCDFKLIKGVDLMAVPGIKETVRMVVKMVLEGMMLYPNSMTFPIMTNYGLPPPPKGTLQVTLMDVVLHESGSLLNKINPYVKLEVRENRSVRSKTKSGNVVEFKEQFNLVVDDPVTQQLKLDIFDDDMGWQDPKLGHGEVLLSSFRYNAETGQDENVEADFIRNPKKEITVTLPIFKAKNANLLMAGTSTIAKVASLGMYKGKSAKVEEKEAGTATVRLKFLPFTQPTMDDEDEDDAAAPLPTIPSLSRKVEARVHGNLKGVLTVKLIRCIDLEGDNGTDGYCELRLVDPDPNKEDEVQVSSVVYNENSPRWGSKFDFVMVTATSILQITVKDKTTAMESVMSMKIGKSRFDDKVLGNVAIPVGDIARNGRIKGLWNLGEPAKKGAIELQMDWNTCYISE